MTLDVVASLFPLTASQLLHRQLVVRRRVMLMPRRSLIGAEVTRVLVRRVTAHQQVRSFGEVRGAERSGDPLHLDGHLPSVGHGPLGPQLGRRRLGR